MGLEKITEPSAEVQSEKLQGNPLQWFCEHFYIGDMILVLPE